MTNSALILTLVKDLKLATTEAQLELNHSIYWKEYALKNLRTNRAEFLKLDKIYGYFYNRQLRKIRG